MYNATKWFPREDEQSNNQPHLFDNELLHASSLNWFRFRLGMVDNDQHGERWIAADTFQETKIEVNSRFIYFNQICRVYIMISLSRTFADFGNPGAGKPRSNWRKLYCQNANTWNLKKKLIMGNIGPLARFDGKIGNIQITFYMMGKEESAGTLSTFCNAPWD